jgi:GAF domain-containing protein
LATDSLLVRTLVELADTLVDDFDVVELLTLLTDRCVELLDITAAGLMLAAPEGDLRVVASSSEAMRVVELFELQAREGPCSECFRTGEPVMNEDLALAGARWPTFGPVALEAGFRHVHAVPMRLRRRIIGALNLFQGEPGGLHGDDAVTAQAMADIATIAILQHRAASEARVLADQLTLALNSRIVIEQAKGLLAESGKIDMDAAFIALRAYSRNRNEKLSLVAHSLVRRVLPTSAVLGVQQRPAGDST